MRKVWLLSLVACAALLFSGQFFRDAAFDLSLFNDNPAFTAYAFTTAGCIDVNAGFKCRSNKVFSIFNGYLFAMG